MTEIQEAFEKHVLSRLGDDYGNLERWKPEWNSQNGTRYYASAIIEQDFAFYREGYLAGWEARGKV
jgi:hypothetical protein